MATFFDLDHNREPTVAMMIMLYFELFVIFIVMVAAIFLIFAFRREYPKKLAIGFDYAKNNMERSDLDSPSILKSLSPSKKRRKITASYIPSQGTATYVPSYPGKSPDKMSERSKVMPVESKRSAMDGLQSMSVPKEMLPSKEMHMMYVTAKEHKSKNSSQKQGGTSASESGTQSVSSANYGSKKIS